MSFAQPLHWQVRAALLPSSAKLLRQYCFLPCFFCGLTPECLVAFHIALIRQFASTRPRHWLRLTTGWLRKSLPTTWLILHRKASIVQKQQVVAVTWQKQDPQRVAWTRPIILMQLSWIKIQFYWGTYSILREDSNSSIKCYGHNSLVITWVVGTVNSMQNFNLENECQTSGQALFHSLFNPSKNNIT